MEPIEPQIRLSKLMAEKGICSRRRADEYISQGQVWVNGQLITRLGSRVSPDSKIELSFRAHDDRAAEITILLNKPVGYVSTQPERGYPEATQLIAPENQWRKPPVHKQKRLKG